MSSKGRRGCSKAIGITGLGPALLLSGRLTAEPFPPLPADTIPVLACGRRDGRGSAPAPRPSSRRYRPPPGRRRRRSLGRSLSLRCAAGGAGPRRWVPAPHRRSRRAGSSEAALRQDGSSLRLHPVLSPAERSVQAALSPAIERPRASARPAGEEPRGGRTGLAAVSVQHRPWVPVRSVCVPALCLWVPACGCTRVLLWRRTDAVGCAAGRQCGCG